MWNKWSCAKKRWLTQYLTSRAKENCCVFWLIRILLDKGGSRAKEKTNIPFELVKLWPRLFQKLRRQPNTLISLTRSFMLPRTLVSAKLTHGIIFVLATLDDTLHLKLVNRPSPNRHLLLMNTCWSSIRLYYLNFNIAGFGTLAEERLNQRCSTEFTRLFQFEAEHKRLQTIVNAFTYL